MKPEIPYKSHHERDNEENLLKNFLNYENNKKLFKYRELYKYLNTLNSVELNEILLYIFETQCQSYFKEILNLYKNQYTSACCEMLLLGISLNYLKKCMQYLFENKNKNDNNILKLYSIAYTKTYFYYYVEINYNHFDKCNFNDINRLLIDKDENNKKIVYMRNIYIFRLYFKKFDNFEQFKNFEFSTRNIPIYQDIADNLRKEEKNDIDYIFKESFINLDTFNKYEYG